MLAAWAETTHSEHRSDVEMSHTAQKETLGSGMRRVKGAYTEDDYISLIEGGGSRRVNEDTHTVLYHEVQSEDTLAGLALKYRVTIPDIKKLNNVHNETEMQARAVIKIPILKYGIFSEQTEQLKPPEKKSSIMTEDSFEDGKPSKSDEVQKLMTQIESSVKVALVKVAEQEERKGTPISDQIISVPTFEATRWQRLSEQHGSMLYVLIAVAFFVAASPVLFFLNRTHVQEWLVW